MKTFDLRRRLPIRFRALFNSEVSAIAPTDAEWDQLHRQNEPRHSEIDVIMPVYGGRAETLRAIANVLAASNLTRFELIVINDQSPDPALVSELERLSRKGLFTLYTNDRNVGFVGSVNRGMQLHPDRDVILLNADTEVFHDWIDRLRKTAGTDTRICSVTPLSNAATILSYPVPLRDNHRRLEVSFAQLDALARGLDGEGVEIPTAVGFCMYIRRESLNHVGFFDQDTFGRGYGEENDFCMRARAHGWRHLAAPNIYVHHYSGQSFGREREQLMREAIKQIEARYPGYQREIAAFIAADPLEPSRKKLHEARRQYVGRLSASPR